MVIFLKKFQLEKKGRTGGWSKKDKRLQRENDSLRTWHPKVGGAFLS